MLGRVIRISVGCRVTASLLVGFVVGYLPTQNWAVPCLQACKEVTCIATSNTAPYGLTSMSAPSAANVFATSHQGGAIVDTGVAATQRYNCSVGGGNACSDVPGEAWQCANCISQLQNTIKECVPPSE